VLKLIPMGIDLREILSPSGPPPCDSGICPAAPAAHTADSRPPVWSLGPQSPSNTPSFQNLFLYTTTLDMASSSTHDDD
jgi:hypothetical protein